MSKKYLFVFDFQFQKIKFNTIFPEEVHAELIYAASLAFHGTLSLLTRAYTLRDMVTIFKTLRQSKKSYK